MSVSRSYSGESHGYAREESGGSNNILMDESQSRANGSSTRSSASRSKQQNPQQQLSTIEKSVTHLLVATKQLLETLTMWSRGTATEGEVSDVYVRLGYEFNIACRAFNAIGVETTDLGPVPDLLRSILEDTLSQEASQASLDKYLPRIRDIIINLLHGLKKKQQRLRQRPGGTGKDGLGTDTRMPRHGSTTTNASNDSSTPASTDDLPVRSSSSRSFSARQDSDDLSGPDLPPRTTSVISRSPPRRQDSPYGNAQFGTGRKESFSDGSSTSTTAMQNIPIIAPYPETDTIPTNETAYLPKSYSASSMPPLPPPPKQNDALTALQRGGDLERRASRRFSAYQIQKHLGGAMNGLGALPPTQNSPIPNRGRETRESLKAVRSRTATLHARGKSRNDVSGFGPGSGSSPTRGPEDLELAAEETVSFDEDRSTIEQTSTSAEQIDSPTVKTPEDKLGVFEFEKDGHQNELLESAEELPTEFSHKTIDTSALNRQPDNIHSIKRYSRQVHPAAVATPSPPQFVPEGSPQAGRELTLFLQYKSKIKKFVLPDGGDLSVPRLQLAFIEKFAWNTHNNGVDLPEIYVQDPVSGVRHELEDLADVKDRSVLVLNVEALDEVKRHFDDGMGNLRRIVEGIKGSIDEQQSTIQRISDRQQETAKEVALIAAVPPSRPATTLREVEVGRKLSIKDRAGQVTEVQSLRRDLAVIRQVYTSFAADVDAQMATIRHKAASVKKAAADAIIPEMDENTGRAYVNGGKKSLSSDSEKIVNRVDDLQDLVEDLRKDVVSRGVRPLPRQLESVSRDISIATAELKKMQEYLRKEKPIWTKIWEKELQVVCDDRDLLTMQEELAADLEDDLEKAAATFALVEEATKQQNLQNPTQSTPRSTSRTLAIDQGADPHKAKDNLLGEVRALQPNHESRLEAIERAERSRQRELEDRRETQFAKELGDFVGEGKLKKSGGVEEVERIRQQREERARMDFAELQARRRQQQLEKELAAIEAQSQPQPESAVVTAEDQSTIPHLNGTADGQLEVPERTDFDRESSPEADFVEAKEEVTSLSEGNHQI